LILFYTNFRKGQRKKKEQRGEKSRKKGKSEW